MFFFKCEQRCPCSTVTLSGEITYKSYTHSHLSTYPEKEQAAWALAEEEAHQTTSFSCSYHSRCNNFVLWSSRHFPLFATRSLPSSTELVQSVALTQDWRTVALLVLDEREKLCSFTSSVHPFLDTSCWLPILYMIMFFLCKPVSQMLAG